MKLRVGASLFVVLALVTLVALAAVVARNAFSETKAKTYRVTMLADLRGLDALQRRKRANRGRYAKMIDSSEFRWSSGVHVVELDVTDDHWSAVVRHAGAPDECSIDVSPSRPGAPTCR